MMRWHQGQEEPSAVGGEPIMVSVIEVKTQDVRGSGGALGLFKRRLGEVTGWCLLVL